MKRNTALKLFIIATPVCGLMCLVLGFAGAIFIDRQFVNAATPTPFVIPTVTPDIGDEARARAICQDFIRDELKAPLTAVFASSNERFSPATGPYIAGVPSSSLYNSGLWRVDGEVDAQNSFGVMLRHSYSCVMDYDKTTRTWYSVSLSIEAR